MMERMRYEGVCVGMTPVDVARVSGRGLVAAEHKWGRLRWKGVDRVGTKAEGEYGLSTDSSRQARQRTRTY